MVANKFTALQISKILLRQPPWQVLLLGSIPSLTPLSSIMHALTQTTTLLPHSTQTKSAHFVDLTLSSIHKEIAPPPHPKFLGLYIESNHNIQVLNEAFHNIIIGGSKHQGLARAEDLQWPQPGGEATGRLDLFLNLSPVTKSSLGH